MDYLLIEDNAHTIAGIVMLAISLFGFVLSFRVKRTLVFKFKVAVVYIIPLIMGTTYITPIAYISHTYKILLICAFLALTQVLYWREVKELTSSMRSQRKNLPDFLDISPDMIWMKDLNHRFTYTNEAIRKSLLKCTEEEAFGKTGLELAEMQRSKGHTYTFGEICNDSDEITILKKMPCRFLEFGDVNGTFLALQVFKAPIYSTKPDGTKVLQGTIGIGRDLTYDFIDHENIHKKLVAGDLEAAFEVFKEHRNRYLFTGTALINKRNRTTKGSSDKPVST